MTTPPGCGLVSYGRNGSRNYLPLASVSAKVHIVDVSARVILTQQYISDHNSDSSTRAQYIFPVPATGAVCAFNMRASSGQAVTGVVMERSKAKREYELAISNDKWAGLLCESTPDVFVITIGAIPRRQSIEVTIMYVIELSDGDLHDRVEFSLPTYIAERYGPAPSTLGAPSSSSSNTIFDVTVQIQMTSQILSVTSPSHLIKRPVMESWIPTLSSLYYRILETCLLTRLLLKRQHVDAMNADMGGTEMETGLGSALDSRMRSVPTSLFLLTDGEVWGYDEIFSSVDSHVKKAGNTAGGTYLRIFTLGIGDAASTAICEGVARRGNGLSLMTSHSSDISQKVLKLFSASRVSPLGNVGNLEIDWGNRSAQSGSSTTVINDKGKITHRVALSPNSIGSTNTQFHITLAGPPKVQQAPTQVPNLYPNNRFTVFVILSDTTEVPETVTLRGTFPDGSPIAIPLKPTHETADGDFPPLVHTLAAHRLILELEDGDPSSQGSFDATDKKPRDEVIEAAVVRFSETYQLANQFASFIAIYEAEDGRSDSDSETDSDYFFDGRSDIPDSDSDISDAGARDGRRQSMDLGSRVGQPDPERNLDQQSNRDDSDDNSSQARRGDGADPSTASDDDGDFSSVSSMSSHSSTQSRGGDMLPFRLLKYLLSAWRKASRPKPAMRREVDMPGAWLEAERMVVVTPARQKPRKKPVATVTSNTKASVVTAARLQQFDGSFNLDEKLCSLISNKLSPPEIKSAIPTEIQGLRDADKIWATVLVAAYMKVHLGDDRDMWLGLWKKAEDFIKAAVGDKISFSSLVDEASKLLA
ncbi:hypothetical protein GALMADRAFT_142939 [Galerina marginata CBS 339.88]|uniref:VIT domain-containing protein n=1 Tax=Galerina marginata (strain CBS 339.88) TaxID=685588 RepID=A0A067SNW6_GALM3|nr:hypothetical protein GALMADRAFT_142939 [Galerina marginata CBS 339.88]